MSESISASLHRAIAEAERTGLRLTEITISDAAARELADELAALSLLPPRQTASEIYQGIKAGTSKFMHRQLTVASD